ncbi:MAG: glutathione S-transferase family protein [Magnetovibrio sp.]|nr:glutathione S-transferase family protein [Magnetovibrio sp.]
MSQPDLVLYHSWISSASRKVRFCLAEKGLAYKAVKVSLSNFEHHSDWYKKLNPSGVVPALLVDGEPIVESNFINEYLDDRFPSPLLRPTDAHALYDMRLWSKYIDDVCLPAIQKHNWMTNYHPMAREWTDAELEERLAAIPTENRRHVWYRMARDPYTADELETALDILTDMRDRIEARTAAAGWITGSAFSLADINAAPYAKRLEELDPTAFDPDRFPNAGKWWRAVSTRPGFVAAKIENFVEQGQPDYDPDI